MLIDLTIQLTVVRIISAGYLLAIDNNSKSQRNDSFQEKMAHLSGIPLKIDTFEDNLLGGQGSYHVLPVGNLWFAQFFHLYLHKVLMGVKLLSSPLAREIVSRKGIHFSTSKRPYYLVCGELLYLEQDLAPVCRKQGLLCSECYKRAN